MFCNRVKEFLHERGVAFEERDVAADAQALNDLQRLGWVTTPVTVFEGEVIVGFDAAKLEALIRRRG